jgi:aminoglycoside phosphotransferase (APT) family kinase protein
MFATDDPRRLVAVFDWDMCTLGDPLADLGALLTYWREPDDPPAFRAMAMMPTGAGFASRAQMVERYARQSGLDVSGIRYYHALGLYRLAVILAQIFVRFHRGQTRDERFAPFGDFTRLAAAWAQRIALAED